MTLLLLLLACSNDPTRASFTENVGTAFEECNPAEHRFLAGKHNFMLAFEACGSNHFEHFAWSPKGTHLYFQLTHSGHVMDAGAEDKRTITVPTETPVGPAAWLTGSRLAVPVGSSEEGAPVRVAVFDQEQATLMHHPLPGLSEVRDLAVGETPSELYLTAVRSGRRAIVRLDLDDGTVAPAFPWADALPVETFSYTPEADAVLLGAGGTVTLHDAATGEAKGSWKGAQRGILHPKGRWLALEQEGAPVSIFYQRSWDELSEHARARELERAREFEARLPEHYPREVRPPTIGMVDLENGRRWVFTGFQGDRFQWYASMDFYASLMLWGFEGKEMNRNVVLGNLADRLRSMERDEEMLGVERYEPPAVEAAEAGVSAESSP